LVADLESVFLATNWKAWNTRHFDRVMKYVTITANAVRTLPGFSARRHRGMLAVAGPTLLQDEEIE